MMLVFASLSWGQSKFIVFGAVTNDDMNRREGDVTVSVTVNGSPLTTTVTSNSGKFKIPLDYGKKYKIEFSKGGLVARHLYVDLVGVNEEDLPAGDLMQEMEMTLYAQIPDVDMSFFAQEPTTTFSVNMKKMMTEMDRKQVGIMKDKIDAMLAQKEKLGDQTAALKKQYDDAMAAGDKNVALKSFEEALKNYQEAQRVMPNEALPKTKIEEVKAKIAQLAEEKKLAEAEAKYNEAIAIADKAFVAKEWDNALKKYEEALGYKANDKHASDRIVAIDEILSAQRRAELDEKQKNEEYYNLIKAADNLRDQKNYDKSIETYQQALLKKDEQYPKDQIKAIQEIKAKAEAQAKLDKDYNDALNAAKGLLSSEKYQEAKAKYQEASALKPAEKEPKDKIAEIDKILSNLAEQEQKNKAYADAMQKADQLFASSNWADAIVEYQKASAIKPTEQLPKDKIAEAETKIKNQQEQAKIDEAYNKKVAEANLLFDGGKLEDAKKAYEAALVIKSGEAHPTQRIEQINSKLAELNEAAENQKKYDSFITEANTFFAANKYTEAKTKFEAASQVKPNEQLPKDKIKEIEGILSNLAIEAKLDEDYNKAIQAGASALAANDLNTAKTRYEEAKALKPNEKVPQDKLAEIAKLIKEKQDNEAKEAAYNKLITEADANFNSDKLDVAKLKYEEALKLKTDSYPTQKLKDIEQKLADKAAKELKEKQYKDAITLADQLYASNKLQEAIKAYEESLKIDDTNPYPKSQIKLINDKIAENQSAAEKDAKFAQLVSEGNTLAASNKLSEAVSKYEEALSYKEDASISQKITALKTQIEAQKNAELKEKNYTEAIARAQQFEASNNLQSAVSEYQNASSIKPEESMPKEKIAALQAKISAQSADQQLTERINKLVTDGDKLLNAGDFESAKQKYQEALSLKNDPTIAAKIADVEARMKAETMSQVEKNYQKIIDKADQLKNAKEFDEAISYYERALTIKPGDKYPTDKIKEIRDEIAQQKLLEKQSAEIDAKYNEAIKKGDAKLASNDLSGALEEFVKAKNLKPNEPLPTQKIEQINNLMASKMSSEKDQQEYKRIMAEGNKLVDARSYDQAILSFEKALTIKPGDGPAQTRINEVKALIELDKNATVNQKYSEWVGQGNRAFGEENYDVAKNAYTEALKVKPNDKFAQDRINEINLLLENLAQQKLREAETEQAYRAVITKADNKFVAEDWKTAQAFYQEALTIRPSDKYAKDQLNASIQKQRDESDREASKQYQKIIDKGNEYFGDKNWEKAKDMYERALTLRAHDQYPKDKISEIERILSNGGKEPVKLEDLGKRENISILEGEALFVKAEENRKYKRNLKIKKGSEEIDDKSVVRSLADEEQRLAARGVVTDIENEKSLFETERADEQQATTQEVKALEIEQGDKRATDDLFKYAELLRSEAYARQIEIEKEDVYQVKTHVPKENEAILKGNIYEIEQKLRNDAMAEQEVHQETRSLVVSVEDKHTDFQKEDKRVVDANEAVLREFRRELKTKSDDELTKEYDEIQKLILALEEESKKKTASEQDLLAVSKDIDAKIDAVNKEISDKVREKAISDYDVIKEIEQKIKTVDKDLTEDNIRRDEDRQENVETVKDLHVKSEDVHAERSQDKKGDILDTKKQVNTIEEKHTLATTERTEDREEILEKVKGLEKKQGDHISQKTDEKEKDLYLTKQTVSNIEEGVRKEKVKESEKQLDNNESIKDTKKDLEDKSTEEHEKAKKKTVEISKMLDELDSKGIRYSESVANTLGEEFPEGVTEQNFSINDEDGLLIQMKTRRIVVKNGRGDVYVRSSSKYGTTYTKNGMAITEHVWQRDTQDAKLVRHKTN